MQNKWESNDMESKIKEVLSDSKYRSDNHHFKRPFLTPYQIGIELLLRYPTICEDLNMQFGGKGTGTQNSVVQYIANELSSRIKRTEITDIQGVFLSNDHLNELSFCKPDGKIVESSNQGREHLSLFRLKM